MQIIADASGNLIHASVISVYFCLLCCYNSQTTESLSRQVWNTLCATW